MIFTKIKGTCFICCQTLAEQLTDKKIENEEMKKFFTRPCMREMIKAYDELAIELPDSLKYNSEFCVVYFMEHMCYF